MFRLLCFRNTPSLWRPASGVARLATQPSHAPQPVESIRHVMQAAHKLTKLRPPKIHLQQYLRGPETLAEGVVKTICTTCRAPSSVRNDDSPQYVVADGRYVVRRQSCHGTCDKSIDDVNLGRTRARKYHVPVDGDVPRIFCTSLARAIRIRMTQDPASDSDLQAQSSKGHLR